MTPALRLLADDLTGALDTAAEFVPLCGPVHAPLALGTPLPASAALDTATREADEATARRVVAAAAPALAPTSTTAPLAFNKVDSLIRGHTLPELAALLEAGPWTRAVLAPAFPFQGRTTRAGRQHADGRPVGPDLPAALAALGLPAHRGTPGAPLRPGVTVFDAETDADLDAVVAAIGPAAPVLWCGTGGLARALAATGAPGRPVPAPPLPRPVLGLFGSDQPATAAQLAACAPHWTPLPHGGPGSAAALAARLARHGLALASLDLPPGTPRAHAAERIAAAHADLVRALPRPGTLAAAGGETLRALCLALGARALLVRGRAVPGVPVSTLVGGAWDGVTVLSKSGAFGHPTLLRDLLAPPELAPPERIPA